MEVPSFFCATFQLPANMSPTDTYLKLDGWNKVNCFALPSIRKIIHYVSAGSSVHQRFQLGKVLAGDGTTSDTVRTGNSFSTSSSAKQAYPLRID